VRLPLEGQSEPAPARSAALPLPPSFSLRIATAAGAELRRLRVKAGLSQVEVARRASSHRPIICRGERGVHMPDLATCARIAHACGGELFDVLAAIDDALGWTNTATVNAVDTRS
jgi:DNA-binding XRE family transcriptional regulator